MINSKPAMPVKPSIIRITESNGESVVLENNTVNAILEPEVKGNPEMICKQFGSHLVAELQPMTRSRTSSMNEE